MNKQVRKSIRYVAQSVPTMEGAGVRLKRAFGNLRGTDLDPFLLLDHMNSDKPEEFMAGFPWHPHRGIETVTYMIEGNMEHGDSLGNKGILKDGEIQWMTAGSGIIHQEMPSSKGKILNGLQLWVNLPKSHKMMMPRYQDIKNSEIPITSLDNKVKVRVLAGEYNNVTGPVQDVVSRPTYLDITIDQETEFIHDLPYDHTVIAYVLDGEGNFKGNQEHNIGKDHLIVFDKGGNVTIETKNDHLRLLLMSGEPINETVAWHGPIVMNTQQELQHAFRELQQGSFIKHDYEL